MKILPLCLSAIFILFLAIPAQAGENCLITGDISVEDSNSPLGAFKYTLNVSWDMDSPYGLSHLGLLVDGEGGTCGCTDFSDNIFFETISGTSDGADCAEVNYSSELACNGDPSLNLSGIFFKFEPIEGDCEPGPVGTGSFVFYSDLPGVPVSDQFLGLVDKAGQESCTGIVTGVFPGMACDPVSSDARSFDSLKGLYR
jgi:hypothetical protein